MDDAAFDRASDLCFKELEVAVLQLMEKHGPGPTVAALGLYFSSEIHRWRMEKRIGQKTAEEMIESIRSLALNSGAPVSSPPPFRL